MQRRITASATLAGVVASILIVGATPAMAAPPILALLTPTTGSASTDTTPTFSGISDCIVGACSNITVRVYSGPDTSGSLIQTLTAARAANWSVTATTLADGTYTATAAQTRAGGSGGTTTTLPGNTFVIDTTGPTVVFTSAPANVAEASTASFGYTIDDGQGVGGSSVVISCDSVTPANATNTATSGSFECTYPDDASSVTVSVQATDSLGNLGSLVSSGIDIANVAPSTTFASGPGTRDEGQSGTYSFTFSDPGQDTVQNAVVSCGSGTVSNKTFDDSGVTFDCTFSDSGATTITAQAVDSDGDAGGSASRGVTVANVAPATTFVSGPTTLEQVQTGTYSFSFADAGQDAITDVDVSCGTGIVSGETFDDSGVTFDCLFPLVGTTTVTAAATDADGSTGPVESTAVEVTAPPLPEPEPTPDPDPTPDPEPTPDPDPEPSAAPTPEPAADSSPDPAPPTSSGDEEPEAGDEEPLEEEAEWLGWPLPEGEVTLDTEVVSPNADGKLDEVTIEADFSEPVWWTFELIGDEGVMLTMSGFGDEFRHVWDGSVDRQVVPDGIYQWRVEARTNYASMSPIEGSLIVDSDAPDFVRVDVAKGGRTAASVDVVVGEDSQIVVLIRRGKKVVRRITAMGRAGRPVTLRWDGRNHKGGRARPGRYQIDVMAIDGAGNVSHAPGRSIKL